MAVVTLTFKCFEVARTEIEEDLVVFYINGCLKGLNVKRNHPKKHKMTIKKEIQRFSKGF